MFEWIVSVIARFGYAGVAILTFLENLFPPIPSELIIPLAGFVAAQGTLGLGGVIAAGTLGSLAGATLWYAVARRIGERRFRAWVDRHGKWLTLGREDIDRAQAWLNRHGRTAVLLGRLVPGVRTFVSLPAGFSGMPAVPFLLWSAAGTAGLALAAQSRHDHFSHAHSRGLACPCPGSLRAAAEAGGRGADARCAGSAARGQPFSFPAHVQVAGRPDAEAVRGRLPP
jgi:membrane protein DedA with SNARE-associated domain